jgi:iron complex outermembrane receptor protein
MKASRKSIFLALLGFFTCASLAFGQTTKILGTVKDSEGVGIFSATVLLVGKQKGATTDENGKYEINQLEAGTYKISFNASGYVLQTKEITIATGQVVSLDVTLEEITSDIDEVVVIGYGTTRTKDLTGAATVINEKNFTQGSLASPEQLLMGKVAGVKINSNDGAPGSGSTIRLRGGTSINASNDPLIVIDGVPLDNNSIAGASSPLSLINPNDIASFVILKDASATAIYGSRGANGVIIITTKKGDGGGLNQFKVTLNMKHSISTVAKYAQVLNGDEYRTLVTDHGTAAQAALLGTANTDWQREVFRTAYVGDNNVSLSGGLKNLPYRLSIGNRAENGLLMTDNMNRTSVSFNMNPSFMEKHLELEVNTRFVQSYSNFANRSALGAAYFDPTQSVYSGNSNFGGYFEWLDSGDPNSLAGKNPLGLIMQKVDKSKVSRFIGNAKVSYKLPFFPQVKAVVNAGTDLAEGTGFTKTYATSASGYYTRGSYSNYRQTKGNKLLEAYLNYNNSLNKSKHLIDITAGYSYQDWYSASPNNPTYTEAQDSIISPAAAFPSYTKNALLSFYGRGIYSFNNRYVINAALRRDGSSRFSPDTRWGWFPSVSAAYILSEEKFMKNVKWLSMAKIRGGYGVTGQQDGIGDYAYISNYYQGATTAQYAFGGQYYTVFRPDGFDANLKWEETRSYNIGLDFGFFKDRISGSIDIYRKTTTDLLAVVAVPAGTNFTNQILTNVGSMRNQGIEMSTNIGLVAKKNLTIDMLANATYNKNQVLKLSQINDPNSPGILVGGISGGIGNTVQIQQVGSPTFSYFVYEQRYDSNGKPIESGTQANVDLNHDGAITTADKWKDTSAFVDRNGDGIINIDDRYIFEKAAPNWFLGLSFNITYKKWYAGVSMRGELGGYIYNNIHSNNGTYQAVNGTQGYLNNISQLYYQEQFQNTTERQLLSDHYLEKANFLRMDYFSLGYKFDKLKFTKDKVGLNASLMVQNVFVLTKYSGLDPEVNGGIDNNIYPRPRVFSLNLTFDF